MSEKKEHFSDVNKYWTSYDVLIYTPTVSAGVSFELKHFNKVFGFFTDQSCPVETCIQMIGRIRDVGDRQHYICLAASGNNLPTDIEAIKSQLLGRRENLMKVFDETGFRFEYGERGQAVLHTTSYFHIWLENMRVRNISKNHFVRRFLHVVGVSGARLTHLTDAMYEALTGTSVLVDGVLNPELAEIADAHKAARGEIKTRTNEQIATARELREDELEEIHAAIHAQKDISREDQCALDKHRLRATYRFDGRVTSKFVEKYNQTKVMRVFKNLSRMSTYVGYVNGGDRPEVAIMKALKQIQDEERANYVYHMKLGDDAQHADLHRRYVFDQHRYAVALVRMCGWNGPFDQRVIHRMTLLENLQRNESLYWENIRRACNEFGVRPPSLQTVSATRGDPPTYIANMLKPINKIFGIMYGGAIVTKKGSEMYSIRQCEWFTMCPTDASGKPIDTIPVIALTPIKAEFTDGVGGEVVAAGGNMAIARGEAHEVKK